MYLNNLFSRTRWDIPPQRLRQSRQPDSKHRPKKRRPQLRLRQKRMHSRGPQQPNRPQRNLLLPQPHHGRTQLARQTGIPLRIRPLRHRRQSKCYKSDLIKRIGRQYEARNGDFANKLIERVKEECNLIMYGNYNWEDLIHDLT